MEKISTQENIKNTKLADALGERYLSYALSTIMSRSLPDVRDGLKPVHRRLLYAMRELKLNPNSGFKKCARVVGDVIGKYHPHGDAAVYDALVRLAQNFAQRYPLIDGQGNFGNIDGDNAAAMRYTEARLTDFAEALLVDIDKDTVDFKLTYDGEETEPIVLPAQVPNLLANGATGIAVGMATSIPPHNLGELIKALKHLIKYPNATTEKLVDIINGPDFPTGGILVEPPNSILDSYKSGRGSFRLRAKWIREELGHGIYQIVITEIPYQVQKSKLIEKIAELLLSKKLPLLADIVDESTETVRIVLEPKNRSIDPNILMEHLFKYTDLETRISLNMNVLDKYSVPQVMDLRKILSSFLEHRHEILIRRSNHKLEKISRRLEILKGFLIAYLNLDEVIKIIREEEDPKTEIVNRYRLSDLQVESILNMRLRQLHKLEEIEIKKENDSLLLDEENIQNLLNNEQERWTLISNEIQSIGDKLKKVPNLLQRKTTFGSTPSALIIPLEANIEKEPITVVCSEKGWIKTLRGHLDGPNELKFKEGDSCGFYIHASTTDKLIVFASNGRFYTIGCDKLPTGRGHGEPLRLMIELESHHEFVNMFIYQGDRKMVVASHRGRGFIINETDLIAQTKNGKQILNLNPQDKGAAVTPISNGHDSIAIIGTKRKLLIFNINELPVLARGKGVILQKYAHGNLSDITSLKLSEGLKWETSVGKRVEPTITKWAGKRAQTGQIPFKGFPKSNKFRIRPIIIKSKI